MAEIEATGGEFRARAGTLTLLFMTSEESREDLLDLLERALQGGLLGEVDEVELEEELGERAERRTEGPMARVDPGDFIGPQASMKATSKGELFLAVGLVLERWLHNCPDGPLRIGPEGADPLAALVCCWSATVIHALAAEPVTLPDLDRAVGLLDYETTEEHLDALLRNGLAQAEDGTGETRYAPTEWLREGIAPLAAAARAETLFPEEDVDPPDILDVEASFQLTLPLLQLPADLRGTCRLGVQIPGGPPLIAGATAQVDSGRVVTSSTLLEQEPATWATGTPRDWLDTLIDPTAGRIEAGGDVQLAQVLLESLHEKLFGQDGTD
ncbi:MAG TPA: hypothetical protein VIS95_05785 [Solirubrobacterales bacterium]